MATSTPMDGRREPLHVADTGSGAGVLLVHGQPGLGSDWDPVTALLVADHRVLVPDRPGYGRSSGEPAGMAENAELLAELLVRSGAGPAVVVGHSYGGGIAVLLAARHPALVRALVLVASVGEAGSVNGFDHVLALPVLGEVLSVAGLVTMGRILPRLRPLSRVLPPALGDRLRAGLPDRQYALEVSRLGWRMCRSFLTEQRSLLAEIGDVQRALRVLSVPTAVMTGTWDTVVPPTSAAATAASIRGSELVTVARAGHYLLRDTPSVVAAAVRHMEARAGT